MREVEQGEGVKNSEKVEKGEKVALKMNEKQCGE